MFSGRSRWDLAPQAMTGLQPQAMTGLQQIGHRSRPRLKEVAEPAGTNCATSRQCSAAYVATRAEAADPTALQSDHA
jgi:hypothetical protein